MVENRKALLIPKSLWKHFKGEVYQIIAVGNHSESEDEMVVYTNVRNNAIWIRPINMFLERIYPVVAEEGAQERFEYLGLVL